MMKKNHYLTIGILGILLLSLGLVNAAVSLNNVSIYLNQTSMSNVSAGETYTIKATIENQNDTDFYVSFRTTNWDSWGSGAEISAHSSKDFLGVFTIPSSKPSSRGAYVDIYNASNHSQKLFELSRSISLNYIADDDGNGNGDENETDEGLVCIAGDKGDLEIDFFAINNLGIGDDEEWNPLDKIEIEVEVENNNRDDNVADVIVGIIVLNKNGEDVTDDFDFDDEEIDLGRIKSRESETAVFKIPELSADIEEGIYKIYMKAYSEDDEDSQCVSTSKDFNKKDYYEIEIVRENDPAVIVKSDTIKVSASCGQEVILNVNVYNIGSDTEKKVLVTLGNSELGISEKQVITNLRSGKQKELTFVFKLPDYLPKEIYDFSIKTYFDYDKDDEMDEDSYDDSSDDIDMGGFTTRLEMIGCKVLEPTINAQLVSDTKVEEELVVRVTLKNNADEPKTFIISPEGYEMWGSLISIEPTSGLIEAGQSQDFLITFIPEKSGVQTFKINVIADDETYEQPFSVNIAEKSSSFNFANLDKISFYLLIGIGLLIILILILLIVRVSTRGSRE